MATPEKSWFRRVVPQGYVTAVLTLIGTAPLLMNSAEADHDGELYRAFYMLGQKKSKTLEDEARLRELEWKLRIYLDEEIGPYVPGRMVKELLRTAATKWKKGEDIKRSLIVVPTRIPLQYEGPRDEKGLWDGGFRYTTMVSNAGFNRGRVLRCRPMFEGWSIETDVAFDGEDLDIDFLKLVVERSQKYGLGDYRPEFGSFTALLNGEVVTREASPTTGVKARNGSQEKAHEAFKSRILVKSN